jgi:hypothetical protein
MNVIFKLYPRCIRHHRGYLYATRPLSVASLEKAHTFVEIKIDNVMKIWYFH